MLNYELRYCMAKLQSGLQLYAYQIGENMSVLKEFKPAEVWKYFEKICEIPHGSSNTKMIRQKKKKSR